jgi:hypothetical protein
MGIRALLPAPVRSPSQGSEAAPRPREPLNRFPDRQGPLALTTGPLPNGALGAAFLALGFKTIQPFISSSPADPEPTANIAHPINGTLDQSDKLASLRHDRLLVPGHGGPPSETTPCILSKYYPCLRTVVTFVPGLYRISRGTRIRSVSPKEVRRARFPVRRTRVVAGTFRLRLRPRRRLKPASTDKSASSGGMSSSPE